MKTKIAFMFLGGLPNPSEDSGKCWRIFLKNAPISYFKKIVFVVHPINETDKPLGFWKRYLTYNLNSTLKIKTIYLNTPSTHLKTAWATRSLVDATILMIKIAYKIIPTIQKFVLLEGKTCPLYNLKTICDTILKNNKNWIDPLNNSCKEEFINNKHPNLYCPTKKCLQKKDCSFWSQWMILDVEYIKNLLYTDIKKDKKPILCNNGSMVNQITVKNKSNKISNNIQQSLIQMLDIYNKPCQFADELYFGLMLKKNRTVKEFINIINTIDKDMFITNYKSIKKINDNKKYVLPIFGLYTNKKSNNIKNVNYNNNKYVNSVEMNNHYNNNKYVNSLPFYLSSISFNDKALTSIFSLSSVYTDWNHFNINPFNIFRSFKYKNLNINKLLTNSNNNTINELLNINCKYASFNSLNLNQLPYWAHPLEYNTIPLYQYINGYNLLLYFSSINKDEHLNYILSLYKISLKKIGFKFILKYSIKYDFLITLFNLKILVGTFITNKILNNARMRGCLFIRKCEKGSNINKYANQLYKKNTKYIYKNIVKKNMNKSN
jgi:hypothetical protein